MNIEAALNELYEKLQRAQAELSRAEDDLYSCQVNTPGRCDREADRVKRAEGTVASIERSIRHVAVDVE